MDTDEMILIMYQDKFLTVEEIAEALDQDPEYVRGVIEHS